MSLENWVTWPFAQFFSFCTMQPSTMVLTHKIMTTRSRAAKNPKIFSGRFRCSSRVRKSWYTCSVCWSIFSYLKRFQNFAFCVVLIGFGDYFLLFSFRPKGFPNFGYSRVNFFFTLVQPSSKICPFFSWFLVWGAWMQSFGIFWPTRYPWLPAWTNSALWFSYRKDLFSGWRSIFWFICELFVKNFL